MTELRIQQRISVPSSQSDLTWTPVSMMYRWVADVSLLAIIIYGRQTGTPIYGYAQIWPRCANVGIPKYIDARQWACYTLLVGFQHVGFSSLADLKFAFLEMAFWHHQVVQPTADTFGVRWSWEAGWMLWSRLHVLRRSPRISVSRGPSGRGTAWWQLICSVLAPAPTLPVTNRAVTILNDSSTSLRNNTPGVPWLPTMETGRIGYRSTIIVDHHKSSTNLVKHVQPWPNPSSLVHCSSITICLNHYQP